VYKVDPRLCSFTRNLLSKDRCRATLLDKPLPRGPKVPLVSKPCAFACRAERLAWAGSGPDGFVVGPTGLAEGVTPDADSGEEVALSVSQKVIWRDIFNTPFVHIAWCDMPLFYQLPEPSG
jgi:hypothetical protein